MNDQKYDIIIFAYMHINNNDILYVISTIKFYGSHYLLQQYSEKEVGERSKTLHLPLAVIAYGRIQNYIILFHAVTVISNINGR